MDKAPTGVKELDEKLEGGPAPGSIFLVIGEPGSGKTTLLRRFIYEGVKKKEGCVYIMTNRSLDRVLSNMSKLGWDVSGYKKLKFILYDSVVNKRNESLVGNMDDLVDIGYSLGKLCSDKKAAVRRVVIEDLSYFFLMNPKEAVFKFLQRVGQIVRENDVSCMMEVQKGMLDPKIATSIESIADGTIEAKGEEGKKMLRVTRAEGLEASPRWVPFGAGGKGAGIEAERHLEEWQRILREKRENGTDEVEGLVKDIKKKSGKRGKKGLFGLRK